MCSGVLSRPMKGLYFSILQSISMQLTTPTIRNCITWRSLRDVRAPYSSSIYDQFRVYPYFLIIKKCIDGYTLKGSRNLILSTLTNASIWGAEHSVEGTDCHYLADENEDRYLRNMTDQMSSKEMYTIQQLGVPDLDTGFCIHILPTECEDSKSMQLAVGRGGPTSSSRLIYTRFKFAHLASKWETVFSPISFASYGAHHRWCEFVADKLRPKCQVDFPNVKPELVPYAKTRECEEIEEHREEYLRAHKWLLNNVKYAGLQCADWGSGQSINSKMVEPLHCILRVSITCIKWYIVFVIKYCEWIKDERNAKFKRLNHSNHENYVVPEEDEIIDHFQKCCGIPLSYNRDSPGMSKITASGNWRRQLWEHLEDVVSCDDPNCRFRPWQGSSIEPYFYVLFVNLMEVVLPLDILDHKLFEIYWLKYLKPRNIKISNAEGSLPYDTASIWNIYAQHFFTLFVCLLGDNRITRYIHGVVFATNYGMDIARALKSSYRALFGSDVVERMNSLTKTVLHTASSKFGGPNPEDIDNIEDTIGQILKWTHWDRYRFRETSPSMNLEYRLKTYLRRQQRESDIKKMNAPNKMRRRIRNRHHSLKLPCSLSNEYQKNRTFARIDEDDEDVYFYSLAELDDEALFRDHQTHFLEQQLQRSILGFDALWDQPIHDEMKRRDDNWDPDDDDDDYDFDESTLIRRFYRVASVSFGSTSTDVGTGSGVRARRDCRGNYPFITRWSDAGNSDSMRWTPFLCDIAKTDMNFGAYYMRLITELPRSGSRNKKKYRFTWQYEDLGRITQWNDDEHMAIWCKMVRAPDMECKSGAMWKKVTTVPPSLTNFVKNGKIGIFFDSDSYKAQDIDNLVRKWKYFTPSHQISRAEFRRLSCGFSVEEQKAALNMYRASKCPLLSVHKGVTDNIDAIMQRHRAGETRVCLSCKKTFGVFERHVICLPVTENNRNVTRHVYDRLMVENYDERKKVVPIVLDPAKSEIPNEARTILRSDRNFWGMVLMNVYSQFACHLQTNRRIEFMNCRTDADYKKLSCSVERLVLMLNRAMCQTLRIHKRNTDSDLGTSRRDVILKAITVVSNMFILPMQIFEKLGSIHEARKWKKDRRRRIWKSRLFRVRMRNHYQRGKVCPPDIFVKIIHTFYHEFCSSCNPWTFGND